jgi:CheY-like chemotaxis protein
VQLPLLHEAALAAPSPADMAQGVQPHAGTSKRILVVDDNVDSAITLSWLLNQHGYVVETAHDGKSGLQAAHAFKPDILLLDIGLPGINGYELAKRLRAEGFSSAVLIAISGYALEADVERSRVAGFDRHLAKPVDIDHLVRSLAEF